MDRPHEDLLSLVKWTAEQAMEPAVVCSLPRPPTSLCCRTLLSLTGLILLITLPREACLSRYVTFLLLGGGASVSTASNGCARNSRPKQYLLLDHVLGGCKVSSDRIYRAGSMLRASLIFIGT